MKQSENTSNIKRQLFKHCIDYTNKQVNLYSEAINNAQEAANDETKSTAGDKYETARAMKHLEIETFGRRLDETNNQRKFLNSINLTQRSHKVEIGSLVDTSIGTFFIAISTDEIEIDGKEYCPISLSSPIGMVLKDLRVGESSTFRNNTVEVKFIF